MRSLVTHGGWSLVVRFVVVARSDGRGGFRPFGTYTGSQAGAKVSIGDGTYKVGQDGRVSIPRSVMESIGIKGDDGRYRVVVEFSSAPGSGGKQLAAAVSKPPDSLRNGKTGDIGRVRDIHPVTLEDYVIEPHDSGDYNWSP